MNEREKNELERKMEALEETIKDLYEKNLKLSKIVDERIYQISGDLEKNEILLMNKSFQNMQSNTNLANRPSYSNYNFKKSDSNFVDRNLRRHVDKENELYRKIIQFEKKDANSSYNREYTPPVNAIVTKTNLSSNEMNFDMNERFDESNANHRDIKKSANNLINILDIKSKPSDRFKGGTKITVNKKRNRSVDISSSRRGDSTRNYRREGSYDSAKNRTHGGERENVEEIMIKGHKNYRRSIDIYSTENQPNNLKRFDKTFRSSVDDGDKRVSIPKRARSVKEKKQQLEKRL